jgi:hypothetical protein
MADTIVRNNGKKHPYLNLAGIAIGNGVIDYRYCDEEVIER